MSWDQRGGLAAAGAAVVGVVDFVLCDGRASGDTPRQIASPDPRLHILVMNAS